ncbi:tetrapyrrole biosynthesis, uroporphyrinogen III synthase [Copromyces sp. CBS 386.78]|uniref:Tetrapyrrole biosynthesis, uroporphyrinogen III synthase n=1 Tax=Pseudoneurospora amorphoporcata TaxID=241081 RepID=A0AAN6NTI5_9PEZI|nr:tetrapyrrole biosynthesis, uroporphyrinogen III synthase [Copromyces sp. CBS 386.78]KAK3951570.1 tetrapyrrole biosynthesis, uroporphyrinogen III synthase [Pseudoneurospora amorphoporcata]
MSTKTPIFLLKTKSTPGDSYQEQFSSETDGFNFEPFFVPVLEHRFKDEGLATVRQLLQTKAIGTGPECAYGGMVFTSQRAVEAFTHLVQEVTGDERWPHLQGIPVYSVGPATTRALKAVPQQPPLQVFGEHTGNGETLAPYIIEHYGEWYKNRPTKPPLLFLVGEQRRDIIPKKLMDPALPSDKFIRIDEVVVYGTGVMESFQQDFTKLLKQTENRPARWVVVFSPSGCDGMLSALGWLNESSGRVEGEIQKEGRKTYIATIGPTTRLHLVNSFGYEPDVCAEQPSPEGVWEGINRFWNESKE